jgi:hypothetical protein
MSTTQQYTKHTKLTAFSMAMTESIMNGEAEGHALVAISEEDGEYYIADTNRKFHYRDIDGIHYAVAASDHKRKEDMILTFSEDGTGELAIGGEAVKMMIARPTYAEEEYIATDLEEGEPCVYIPRSEIDEPPIWKVGVKGEADFVMDAFGHYIQAAKIYRLSGLTGRLLGKEAEMSIYDAAVSLAEMELIDRIYLGR